MPTYGTPQAGGVVTSLSPGDKGYQLFNGTEVAAQGLKSVSVARGGAFAGDNGISFFASGMPLTSVIQIQASNDDVDGHYTVVGTINPDANGNGAYTDIGRAGFYRAVLSTYVSGAMPVVVADR
ncbi:MAG: hypothetical protein KGL39_20390 [Patescibacteria group bacterium]|nr:hypothetical protein [Patescibacteria group bacterium]